MGGPDPEQDIVVSQQFGEMPSLNEAKVARWRRTYLRRLGFGGATLELLADSPCDLHVAERLVLSGCPLDVAAHILL